MPKEVDEVSNTALSIHYITQPEPRGQGLVTTGRYILTPAIFDILREQMDNGSLELAQALGHMAKKEGAIAVVHEGKRYDMGNSEDWLEANKRVLK